MKKTTYIVGVILFLLVMVIPPVSQAQMLRSSYFNIDWQFNRPMNEFSDVASGWGMNFEGGYYVTSKIALGLYASFHSNNKYIPEQLLHINSQSDLYTDQQHATFQIPFGALLKYRFIEDSTIEPYVSAKLGTMYSRMSSYTQVIELYDTSWGFNIQPELGISIFPAKDTRYGIHLALYYSYSTNHNSCLIYDINGYNNVGFHLGISF